MINDLNKYRKAKVLKEEIKSLRLILKDSFSKLNKYKKYVHIKPILSSILEAEVVLKNYEEKFTEIVNNKGKIDEKE